MIIKKEEEVRLGILLAPLSFRPENSLPVILKVITKPKCKVACVKPCLI